MGPAAPNGKAPTKPPPLPVLAENIPAELKARPQWVTWRFALSHKRDKWTKVPHQARHPVAKASSTNPATWATFDEALAAYTAGGGDGVGYVFAEDDPYCGIDLDKCRDPATGAIEGWGLDLLGRLGSYSEVSPSSTGVKVIVRARHTGEGHKRQYRAGAVEVYDSARFFTITGHRLDEYQAAIGVRDAEVAAVWSTVAAASKKPPPQPPPGANCHAGDAEVLSKAFGSAKGDKIRRLYNGDTSDYGGDDSATDLALCSYLRFWARGDHAQVDRLFRASGLMRQKWDERRGAKTYGSMTLDKAMPGDTYDPTRDGSTPNWTWGDGPTSPAAHRLGELELRMGKPRQTDSSKIIAPVAAYKGGVLVYPFQVTSTDSSRRGPARKLAEMAGSSVQDADAALIRVLADAAQKLSSQEAPDGPSLHQVIARVMPPMLTLTHRTERGTLWSETYGREVSRQEWLVHVTSNLLDACADAHDVPRDATGRPARHDLIHAVQSEMSVVWADLMASLPAAADVDLAEATEAGRKFRRDLVALWTRPQTWEVRQGGTAGGDVASRASLASRARRLAATREAEGRPRWRAIHDAFAAWWRNHMVPGGEVRCVLAMRYELAAQVCVSISGAHDQASLTRLGERYGCLMTEAAVTEAGLSDRLTGGGRLAVLSLSLTEELLAQPEEPAEEAFSDEEVAQ